MRFAFPSSGSRCGVRPLLFRSQRFSSCLVKRIRVGIVLSSSKEISTTEVAEENDVVEVITFSRKLKSPESLETSKEQSVVEEIPSASSESRDQTPLGRIAEKIMSSGAETLIQQRNRPLKINQDILLYRVKMYRRRGTKASSPALKDYWYEKAEKGYLKVLKMDPKDGRVYVGLGRLYELWKKVDKAKKLYEDGCAVSAGQSPYIWTSWGNLELKTGKVDVAREYFKAAVAADRTHQVAWHSWGRLEKSVHNYQAARDCWIEGLKNTEGRPSPYLYQSLALLSSELGLYDDARKWFKKGTAVIPNHRSYALWSSWALMEAELRNFSVAEELFAKTLQLNCKSRYTYLKWGQVMQKAGNISKARYLFQKGSRINSSDPALLHALAMLEQSCGNLDDAREYFRKSVEIDPQYQYSWQAWGVLEYRNGDPEKSRRLFERGIWVAPKSKSAVYIFHAWAQLEKSVGNTDIARILFKYGIKLDPKNEKIWESWIILEQDLENYSRANELRKYSVEERSQIALPKDFDMLNKKESLIEDFFHKFSDRLHRWLKGESKTQETEE